MGMKTTNFDSIISSSGEEFSNLSPSISHPQMLLNDDCILNLIKGILPYRWIQVVAPSTRLHEIIIK